jgi:hypothetical protein
MAAMWLASLAVLSFLPQDRADARKNDEISRNFVFFRLTGSSD